MNSKFRFRKAGSPAIILVAIAALAIPSGANAGAEGAKAENRYSLSDASWEDVQFAAASSGEDVDELAKQIAFQELVSEVIDPLILSHPNTYSSSGFDSDSTAYIQFVGDVPADIYRALAPYPEIRVSGGAAMSEADADSVNQGLFAELVEELPSDVTASSRVTPETGQAIVTVSENGLEDGIAEAASSFAAASGASPLARGSQKNPGTIADLTSNIVIEVDESLSFDPQAISGGEKMTEPGKTDTMCTAGFPAKLGTVAGLTTAYHCPDIMDTDGIDTIDNASRFMATTLGDVQWHKAKVTVKPQFRANWGSYHQIYAHPVLKVGTGVCRFGAVSGRGSGCSTVKYVSACVTSNAGDFCQLAMTETHTGSIGGDSGGPWFSGGNAYGTHTGSGTRDGAAVNYFTSSQKAFVKMGLTAMISTS